MKAVIVDDEKPARENLVGLLNRVAADVDVIGEANSVESAVKLLSTISKVDVVFLDINLKDGSGFNVIEKLRTNYQIVFVTAYDNFAISAFKVNALDYILKPLNQEDLAATLNKVRQKISEKERLDMTQIISNWKNGDLNRKLMIRERSGSRFVPIKDIVRCQSDSNYTTIYLSCGERITTAKTLKEYTQILEQFDFFRIHQSHLVNIHMIKRISYEDGGMVETMMGDSLYLSRRNKDAFLQKMAQITSFK